MNCDLQWPFDEAPDGCGASVCILTPQRPSVRCVPAPPTPPTHVSARAAAGGVRVEWGPPSPSHGVYAAVEQYVLRLVAPGGSPRFVLVSPNATAYNVTGLINGVGYDLDMWAVNAAGVGAPSSTIGVVPAAAPGAPGDVSAVGMDAGALVRWAAPAYSGAPINRYDVESLHEGDGATGLAAGAGNQTELSVAGLVLGDAYRFRVRGASELGAGAWSDWSPSVRARGTGFVFSPGTATLVVTGAAVAYAGLVCAGRRWGGSVGGMPRDYTGAFAVGAAVYQVVTDALFAQQLLVTPGDVPYAAAFLVLQV